VSVFNWFVYFVIFTGQGKVVLKCVQHGAAVAAGFRNSGLSVGKHGKIIAVCYCRVLITFCCAMWCC